MRVEVRCRVCKSEHGVFGGVLPFNWKEQGMEARDCLVKIVHGRKG